MSASSSSRSSFSSSSFFFFVFFFFFGNLVVAIQFAQAFLHQAVFELGRRHRVPGKRKGFENLLARFTQMRRQLFVLEVVERIVRGDDVVVIIIVVILVVLLVVVARRVELRTRDVERRLERHDE